MVVHIVKAREGDNPLVELFGSGRAFEAHLGEFDDLWVYQQTEAQWAEIPYAGYRLLGGSLCAANRS